MCIRDSGTTTQYSLRNTYDGELCQGMRHGFGVFRYANGARYEGEWKHNVKSGKVCSLPSFIFALLIGITVLYKCQMYTYVKFESEIYTVTGKSHGLNLEIVFITYVAAYVILQISIVVTQGMCVGVGKVCVQKRSYL